MLIQVRLMEICALSACLERLLRNCISVSGFRIRQQRLPRLRIHLGVSLSGERKLVMSISPKAGKVLENNKVRHLKRKLR